MKWKIKKTKQGYHIKGPYSFTVNNKYDAEKICKKLNQYESTIQNQKNTTKNIHKIEQQITQLKLTINILNEEIQVMNKLI